MLWALCWSLSLSSLVALSSSEAVLCGGDDCCATSTALEGYNSSNLYGKRTLENQTQLENPAATNTTSLGGYAPTPPLPPQPIQPTQQIFTPAAPSRQKTPQGLCHNIAPIRGTIVQQAPPNHKQRAPQLQVPQTSLNESTGQLPRPSRRTMVRLLHGDPKWATRSTTHPHVRYRTSSPNEFTPPRLHSNLHHDYLRLYCANRQHHRAQ
jgi:hypothetical protein